jgi:hypothetical protein
MDGFMILIGLVAFVAMSRHLFRVWLSVKHPKVLSAWEAEEAKRVERNKKLAGGALRGGLGIAKILMKK